MAASFKQETHANYTLQHTITLIHVLSGWLPFQSLLLHNWTIRGKVHTMKINVINETAVAIQTTELEVRQTNSISPGKY